MNARETRVDFVCFRAAHYRKRSAATAVCEHFGCPAYCPAGDVGDHEWVALSTDLARLARLGYAGLGGREEPEEPADRDSHPVLIR